MENTAYCNGCPKNCPLNALRCGRGRAYLEQQHQEGKFLEIALPASEEHDHGHDHDCEHRHGHACGPHSGRHGRSGAGEHGPERHGQERGCGWEHGHGCGHGPNPGGHGGWRGEGAPDVDMENPDGLYALMRACGHVLYHQGGRKSGQGRILRILSHCESMSQRKLQEILGIQTGSLSEILAKMESAGLIERERDETDRRRSIVRLTQTGRDRAGKCRAGEHPDMFSALNEEQKNQLKELLSILLADWKA